jgi:hypothetical protein
MTLSYFSKRAADGSSLAPSASSDDRTSEPKNTRWSSDTPTPRAGTASRDLRGFRWDSETRCVSSVINSKKPKFFWNGDKEVAKNYFSDALFEISQKEKVSAGLKLVWSKRLKVSQSMLVEINPRAVAITVSDQP